MLPDAAARKEEIGKRGFAVRKTGERGRCPEDAIRKTGEQCNKETIFFYKNLKNKERHP
jgi:hypothetical protein